MTIDSPRVHEELSPDDMAFPVAVGWNQAAIAVNSILQLKSPMLLKMRIESHGPLLIDFRHHAFSWSTPLEEFPADAVHSGLETQPTDADGPPLFELPGKDLDGLLWEMGINSFGGSKASWLKPGERYKLTRWPNLTKHSHTMRQMHMMAMLGNAYVSTAELAKLAGVEESEAQRLINALSLMRILNYSAEVAAPTVAIAQTAATKRKSLFGRLRSRLGR
jgi:hypothetical protein